MKKFMISFALIACMAVSMAIGMYVGGHLAQADPAPAGGDPVNTSDGIPEWRDDLIADSGRDVNATAVPSKFLLYQSVRCVGLGEDDMFFIVVAKEKFDVEPGKIISPDHYELHVYGYDPDEGKHRTMEDFPPIFWP